MSTTVKIRNISAEPGQKSFGFLDIAQTPYHNVTLPVGILNGTKEGPTLVVTTGSHPGEVAGVESVIRIYQQLDPKDITGTLIVVPVINSPGFHTGSTFACPIDGTNLNSIYPGNKDGTIGQQIVYVLFNEVIRKGQYHIDIHGGGVHEDSTAFAAFSREGNTTVDDLSEEMAKIYSSTFVWDATGVSGSAHDGSAAVTKSGIPSITGDAGSLGLCIEEEVQFHVTGVQNVMKHLGMLEGTPTTANATPRVVKNERKILTKQGGFFYPEAKPGMEVSEGQRLGVMKDLQGAVVEEIVALTNAIVKLQNGPYKYKSVGEVVYKTFD